MITLKQFSPDDKDRMLEILTDQTNLYAPGF